MSDTEPTPDEETPDPDATEDTDTAEDDGAAKLRREAAKYRRSLRDTEAERDALRSLVNDLRRADVERLAALEGLARADDLWLAGTQLDDLLDDDGAVDPVKVKETVDALTATRPHWRHVTPPSFDGGARTPPPKETSWAEALRRQ